MPDVWLGPWPTFKPSAAWRLDRLNREQGPARPAPDMPSGLPRIGSGPGWRAAGLLLGGRALRPGRPAWVARAAAARRGAAAMKCCTRRRCSSESPQELHADSSVSAEDVRLSCSATFHEAHPAFKSF